MSWWSAIAVYVVIWWIALFAVLPWGVRTQDEEDDVVPGSASSAPSRPFLLRKVIATTLLAAAIFAALWLTVGYFEVTLDDIPFLPDYTVRR